MKLLTARDEPMTRSNLDDFEHDAMAAHALMQAHDEFWKQDDLEELDARDAVEMIGVRADELMREWLGEKDEVS